MNWYRCLMFSILFILLAFKASAYMVLHTEISPGVEEMQNARDSLPSTIGNNQCVVACYKNSNNKTMVAGYYLSNGSYDKDGICLPDDYKGDISIKNSKYSQRCSNLINCHDQQCWAGGDTGGFYRVE